MLVSMSSLGFSRPCHAIEDLEFFLYQKFDLKIAQLAKAMSVQSYKNLEYDIQKNKIYYNQFSLNITKLIGEQSESHSEYSISSEMQDDLRHLAACINKKINATQIGEKIKNDENFKKVKNNRTKQQTVAVFRDRSNISSNNLSKKSTKPLGKRISDQEFVNLIRKNKITDSECLRLFINEKINPNLKDELEVPLLTIAIVNKFQKFTNYLINRCDINSTNKTGDTPLMIAALNNNFPAFKSLIDIGADLMKKNQFGATVYSIIKARGFSPSCVMSKYIKDKFPNKGLFLKNEAKEYIYRKMLGHAWQVKGETATREVKKQNPSNLSFSLEYGTIELWSHILYKNSPQFCEIYPNFFKDPSLFLGILSNLTGNIFYSNVDLYQRIQLGMPTFISVKHVYKDSLHQPLLFLWGEQFCLLDLGGTETPFLICHYDQKKLTLSHIDTIRQTLSLDDYQKIFFTQFRDELKFEMKEYDSLLIDAGFKSLNKQTCNICSWSSLMAGIFYFMLIYEIKENRLEEMKKNLNHLNSLHEQKKIDALSNWFSLVEKIANNFYSYEKFQQVFSLKKIIELAKKKNFQPEYGLIETTLRLAIKTNFDAYQSGIIKDLVNTYETDIVESLVDSLADSIFDLNLEDTLLEDTLLD